MSKGSIDEGLVYHAGFPNAGEDIGLGSLSLDNLIVKHRLSTFFWRLDTDIEQLSWPKGSIIVVDRSLEPQNNRMVVAIDETGFRLARYRKDHMTALDEEVLSSEASVWGVVTHCVQAV